jgi:hypothetical protein
MKKTFQQKLGSIQMNKELLEYCNKKEKEIKDLLDKGLIGKSKSLWSSAFYVQRNAKLERGVPRLELTINHLIKYFNG